MTRVKPLTQKAINSITNTGYLNVWEGAVRSSKTVCSEIAWGLYLFNSPESVFIMSGKTIATLYKNVIGGEFGLLALFGNRARYYTDREGNRVFSLEGKTGTKICYCASGYDEKSFQRIRGLTAGGWYADEINLQPRSFIEECFRRTIVSQDRKHFWTLNPDNPNHFIYKDFIDKYEEEGLEGFYLWKFYLDDNLAIPEERKEELKKQYSGVFYRRYILGERCLAEGLVYDMWKEEYIYDTPIDSALKKKCIHYVAVDYGTNNPCRFLDIYDDGETIYVDNEYSWDARKEQHQKTDEEYVRAMMEFCHNRQDPIIVIDPSALSFKTALIQKGFAVKDGKNDVLDGIRVVSTLLANGKVRICKRCEEIIDEFNSYRWDEKFANKGEERVVKEKDHSLDAFRYFAYTCVAKYRRGDESCD